MPVSAVKAARIFWWVFAWASPERVQISIGVPLLAAFVASVEHAVSGMVRAALPALAETSRRFHRSFRARAVGDETEFSLEYVWWCLNQRHREASLRRGKHRSAERRVGK